MVEEGGKPMDIAKSKGMIITVDTAKVEAGVDEILAANAAQVSSIRTVKQRYSALSWVSVQRLSRALQHLR